MVFIENLQKKLHIFSSKSYFEKKKYKILINLHLNFKMEVLSAFYSLKSDHKCEF